MSAFGQKRTDPHRESPRRYSQRLPKHMTAVTQLGTGNCNHQVNSGRHEHSMLIAQNERNIPSDRIARKSA